MHSWKQWFSCRRNHCFCVGRQLPFSFLRFHRENQLTSFWDDIFAGSDQSEAQSEAHSEAPSGTLGHPKLVFPLTVMQQECDAECDTRCDTGFPSLNPQTNVRIHSRNIIFRYFFIVKKKQQTNKQKQSTTTKKKQTKQKNNKKKLLAQLASLACLENIKLHRSLCWTRPLAHWL